MTFAVGQRVQTPKGTGTVVYQRRHPEQPTEAMVVAVVLAGAREVDATLFLAELVQPDGSES